MAVGPRVFSIAPGVPFLPTLVSALLDGRLVEDFSREDGPLALAGATIYVPTRRAARALAEAFAAEFPNASVLLPRILPLGQTEGLEAADAFGLDAGSATFDADLPEAIGDVARRLILTRLILHWARSVGHAILAVDAAGNRKIDPDESLLVARSPADAWHLSGELASLVDEMLIEGVEWSALAPLGTGEFDDYWRITLDFLGIAMTAWPAILAERGSVDAALRQIRLIEKEIARLARSPAGGPIIVAGSTGTNRATAALMAAIAASPRGAIVLPGLDFDLDEESWKLVGSDTAAGHQQAALHRLLPRLGVSRAEVRPLGAASPALSARAHALSEALRPAESTDLWRGLAERLPAAQIEAALADVALIEAPDERVQALAIAIVLREALETPGRTAALITPDRELARRVRGELGRWDVEIEDSGGEPLAQTSHGSLARLIVECVAGGATPQDVLALLAHPLARLGRERGSLDRIAQAAEIGVFRGSVPKGGLEDVASLVGQARAEAEDRNAHPARRHLSAETWCEIEALLIDLRNALAPLAGIGGDAPFGAWLAAHRAALTAVLRDQTRTVRFTGLDGMALADLLAELAEVGGAGLEFGRTTYAAFIDRILRETPVRGPARTHPRIKILGLLEARLLSPDIAVLGGLDETIWPPATRTDAFLNRPMRAELGLSAPERRIGQTALDFVAGLGARRVVLTRAAKRGGAPTVPSRFLQRLAAVAGKGTWSRCCANGEVYLAHARALGAPAAPIRIGRPMPKPAIELRPRKLSVTRIETLRRDPYAIFAERILRLVPLDPVDQDMQARDFGTGLHLVIDRFTRAFPGDFLPPDATERLAALAREIFAHLLDDADFRAFQWPRILRNIDYLVRWEGERRGDIREILVECQGALRIVLASGMPFELTATADRIEKGRDGRLTIIDFKTGQPPGLAEVRVGFAPQLTLEAAMAGRGAFADIAPGTEVAGALYVRLGAGSDGGRPQPLDWRDCSFADVVSEHMRELVVLLDDFDRPETPYLSRPFPKFASRFAVYDHLARVKEWSATGGETGEGE